MEKWEDFKGAFGDGTNNTDVIAFTADATPRAVQLPTAFVDQYVRLQVLGTSLQYFFSTSATAAIVAAAPSATGQQAPTLGEVVPAGVVAKVRVPGTSGSKVYFCWVCAGAGTGVFMTKDSGVPGLLTGDR
jgi:hypothetical protein